MISMALLESERGCKGKEEHGYSKKVNKQA